MKSFSLLLFYVFITVSVQQGTGDTPREEVKLTIKSSDDVPTIVQLKHVKSFLANEHMPLWGIDAGQLHNLEPLKVMQKLGPFLMYHDHETSSAAVYFYRRNEFDGVVNVRYIIKELSIQNNSDEHLPENSIRKPGVFEQLEWGHGDRTGVLSTKNREMIIPDSFAEWKGEEQLPDEISPEHRLHDLYPDNNYVEILIVVNYDMAQELLSGNDDDYTALVSHILILLNSVDMLLSKLDTPKIKINIAGIIVLHSQTSLKFPSECFQHTDMLWTVIEEIDAECIISFMEDYLETQHKKISPNSYDVVLFLTKHSLSTKVVDEITGKTEFSNVYGLTRHPTMGIHKDRIFHHKAAISIVVQDIEYYQNFPILAHEIVHSIGVFRHDVDPSNAEDGICRYNLMREGGKCCEQCLRWSRETKVIVERIFSSSDSCIFKNEPRSLFPPGPRLMLTAHEQCQCYGYESAVTYQRNSFINWCLTKIPNPHSDYCNKYLRCQYENGHSEVVFLVPMDGTPCKKNEKQVCWNGSCVKIKKHT